MKNVVVIGGTNIDYLARSNEPIILKDSNPGVVTKSFGGVGRNIAENLARLGVKTTLLTALGKDASDFLEQAKSINLTIHYKAVDQTPTYLAIHNVTGELVVSLAAMVAIDKFTPTFLKKYHSLLKNADLLIIDSNMSPETIDYVCNTYQVPIYVDLISSAKAAKFYPFLDKIHTLKINALEGKKITGHEDPLQIGQVLLNKGVKSIYLTLGKAGAYHFSLDQVDFYTKAFTDQLINDTGAGDAFYAGAIFAEMIHQNPLKFGTHLAQMTLKTNDTVSKQIHADKIIAALKE